MLFHCYNNSHSSQLYYENNFLHFTLKSGNNSINGTRRRFLSTCWDSARDNIEYKSNGSAEVPCQCSFVEPLCRRKGNETVYFVVFL